MPGTTNVFPRPLKGAATWQF